MQINLNSQKHFLKTSTDYLNGPLWLVPHDERLNNSNQRKTLTLLHVITLGMNAYVDVSVKSKTVATTGCFY